MGNLKQIYATSNEIDLQMLIGLLESQEINTQIIADGAGDYFRMIGCDSAITKRVLVSENDFDKAVLLMKENGFCSNDVPERDSKEINIARIVLVIMAILLIVLFFL